MTCTKEVMASLDKIVTFSYKKKKKKNNNKKQKSMKSNKNLPKAAVYEVNMQSWIMLLHTEN